MRHRHAVLTVLLILLLVVSVAGCKKKPAETVPEQATPVSPVKPPPPPPPTIEVEPDYPAVPFVDDKPDINSLIRQWNREGRLETIYFGYDSSELSDSARRILRGNADWLKAQSDVNVLIEGHCDERGTIEYNLALGERRADSVRSYMANLGIERSRVRIITFGEERPVDPGHNESAWTKNRRAAFLLEARR